MKKLFLYFLLILAGCSPVAPYKPPRTYAPDSWSDGEIVNEVVPPSPHQCIDKWWEIFNDPVLNQLEYFAVDHNQALEAAFHNYVQAKAYTRIAFSYFFPYISLDPLFTKREGSTGFGVDIPIADPAAIPSRTVNGQYTFPINISYEVDLWGAIRNGYLSALYNEQAQLYYLNYVMLAITTDLAENYFILRSLDSERVVLEESLIVRRNSVEINQARYDAGLVNYTDVSRAQTELANVEADYRDNMRLRRIQEDIIATLSGQPAPEFCLPFSPLEESPPEIPAGVPATILSQRPDVRQLEREIASSWADVGIAYADFFPSLTLMGSIGYQSVKFKELFDWKNRFWMYTISIGQMLFDGGATNANVVVAKEQYLMNISNYQQRVLIAYQEVEDALASLKYRQQQGHYLLEAVRSSNETLSLSQIRYDRGLVFYLDVVDAQRSLLDAQRASVRVFGSRYTATVQLIRSLGGAWVYPSDQMACPPPQVPYEVEILKP